MKPHQFAHGMLALLHQALPPPEREEVDRIRAEIIAAVGSSKTGMKPSPQALGRMAFALAQGDIAADIELEESRKKTDRAACN